MQKQILSSTVGLRTSGTRSVAVVLLTLAASQTQAAEALEVSSMSIEDLMKVEVTTVSRKAQRLTDVAAAAFVITSDDIQRSGANALPEVLRMVPGLEVAQLSTTRWAVTARGFNGRFANKLLVLVDGRSIYTPLYSGVFWETEDVLLEDIERIEVIRGPGATLWGANAVNGVINILTRNAKRTQGGLAVAQAGNEGRSSTALRWGDRIDEDTHYRVWAKAVTAQSARTTTGLDGGDAQRTQRAGLRLDRELSGGSRFMVNANVLDAHSGDVLALPSLLPPYAVPTNVSQATRGANAVAKLDWTLANGSQASLQMTFDQNWNNIRGVVKEDRTTVDIDFQNRFQLSPQQDFIWGLGTRHTRDSIDSGQSFATFTPNAQTVDVFSGFVHDEITLIPERWRLILGSKFEHNTYSGYEVQPNVRSQWNLNATDSVWMALSRAVRTPSRAERGVLLEAGVIPPDPTGRGAPLPTLVRNITNSSFMSESVVSLEAGYRAQLGSGLSLDLAAFQSRYRNLRAGRTLGVVPVFTGPQPYLLASTDLTNGLHAWETGLEAALDWHLLPTWRIQTAYTRLSTRAERTGDPSHDVEADRAEGGVPRNQLSLRSSHDLGANQKLDAWLRRIDRLPALNVEAYTALDLRWAWRATPQLELSIAGQNLLKREHVEYVSTELPSLPVRIPRTYAAKARWQF